MRQMPLRDHFHPPLCDYVPWESLHAAWPTLMVMDLNKRLPPRYVASPRVHVGASFEVDVAARESEHFEADAASPGDSSGGAAVAWAPPVPTLAVETHAPDQDEYEVQIIDRDWGKLVAAIEIVSESNKDRSENRRIFAGKCSALLQRGVAVSIVDVVTSRQGNLYGELLEMIGESDPALLPVSPSLYAVAARWRGENRAWRLKTWLHPLAIGRSLPVLPLWLAIDLAVPLSLESTYEETCAALRIR
jgi:hypothetical protein